MYLSTDAGVITAATELGLAGESPWRSASHLPTTVIPFLLFYISTLATLHIVSFCQSVTLNNLGPSKLACSILQHISSAYHQVRQWPNVGLSN